MSWLSDAVLIEIFSQLPNDSLLTASLTCRRWNKLVFNSATLEKLTLYIKWRPCGLDGAPITRKFVNLRVAPFDSDEDLDAYLRAFDLSSVRRLVFDSDVVLMTFRRVLSKTPNLEKLTCGDWIAVSPFCDDSVLNLPHLRRLTIFNQAMKRGLVYHPVVSYLFLNDTAHVYIPHEYTVDETCINIVWISWTLAHVSLPFEIVLLCASRRIFFIFLERLTVRCTGESSGPDCKSQLDHYVSVYCPNLKRLIVENGSTNILDESIEIK